MKYNVKGAMEALKAEQAGQQIRDGARKIGRKIKPVHYLTLLVVIFGILLFIVGFFMRHSVEYPGTKLKETPTIAVPFARLYDSTLLNPYFEESEGAGSVTPFNLSFKTPINEPHQKRELGPVDESYWDEALFIGDSRTVGLSYYRLGNADYFCDIGLSTYTVFTAELSDNNFDTTDLESLLESKRYKKIYIMLGINEAYDDADTVCANLDGILQRIRNIRPNADIFLMANLQITRGFEASSGYITKDKLQAINDHLASLADNTYIFYLDVNTLFCTEDGYLSEEYTEDGCHPLGRCYSEWSDWIGQNGA